MLRAASPHTIRLMGEEKNRNFCETGDKGTKADGGGQHGVCMHVHKEGPAHVMDAIRGAKVRVSARAPKASVAMAFLPEFDCACSERQSSNPSANIKENTRFCHLRQAHLQIQSDRLLLRRSFNLQKKFEWRRLQRPLRLLQQRPFKRRRRRRRSAVCETRRHECPIVLTCLEYTGEPLAHAAPARRDRRAAGQVDRQHNRQRTPGPQELQEYASWRL